MGVVSFPPPAPPPMAGGRSMAATAAIRSIDAPPPPAVEGATSPRSERSPQREGSPHAAAATDRSPEPCRPKHRADTRATRRGGHGDRPAGGGGDARQATRARHTAAGVHEVTGPYEVVRRCWYATRSSRQSSAPRASMPAPSRKCSQLSAVFSAMKFAELARSTSAP